MLGLRTDASIRFEQGISPELTKFAISRAGYLIQKVAGGKVVRGLIDIYPRKAEVKRVKLDLNYVSRLLGVKISTKEACGILKKLGFKILSHRSSSARKDREYLLVQAPAVRLDINIQEDLIEEIGRIYGYEKIKPVFPMVSLIPPKRNLKVFWEDTVKDILKEASFFEVYNYSFISEEIAGFFGFGDLIEVKNPMNSEQKYLRPSLIPNLLKNIKRNQLQTEIKNEQIKIFELGKVFHDLSGQKPKTETGFSDKHKAFMSRERIRLSGLITGDAFYQTKGIVDLLLNKLGISDIWYDQYLPIFEENSASIWKPDRSAEIKIGNNKIGFLGEISSLILEKMKISEKVVAFDLDFEALSKLASEEQEYTPISHYPAAVRDLAVLVPLRVKVVDLLNKINIAGGPLVRDVDLFDIYENENIPDGKKNVAFHIVYQAKDRTLSSKEIQQLQDKIIKAIEENPEWQVRK